MGETIDQQERRMASREMMSFLTLYTQMLELQLEAVKKHMDTTTKELMDGISEISRTQSSNKMKASAVLLQENNGENESSQFTEQSSKERDREEQKEIRSKIASGGLGVSNEVKSAGVELKGHMQHLTNLDAKLQDMLLTMVGTLSTEDVVGQRLSHAISAIGYLNRGLVGLVGDFDSKFKIEHIEKMTRSLEKKVTKSYTMEAEKGVYEKVFG